FLVQSAKLGAFLVEGRLRRQIKAGLLFNALAPVAPRREMTDDEIDGLEEGPPVEVLEGPSGPAFVVVGGRRLPLRGLPLPHPVSAEEMQFFPEGPELRVAVTSAPPPGRATRARGIVRREGPVRGSVTLVRRAWRKV